MSIKTIFSIKDLENLSGVKAHTIRIWEKRYKLFDPQRTQTNIRIYGTEELQKILNIALLNQNGFKVSKIAELTDAQIKEKIEHTFATGHQYNEAYNKLKVSMMSFDRQAFEDEYQSLIEQINFEEICTKIFVRLLIEIGILWHTNTIMPVHEHFISSLISQKILLNIEKLPLVKNLKDKAYVLFLPLNEGHQIGLLYIHYLLLKSGKNSIFLGPNVPIENLSHLQKLHQEIEFVSCFTVSPTQENLDKYMEKIEQHVLTQRNEKFHAIGRKLKDYSHANANILAYQNVNEFAKEKLGIH